MEKKKIVAFCCENSSLKAAEALSDPSLLEAVEIVALPCLGKIEIGLVLKCLEKGHPGVLVLGCPLDNCQYLRGNYRAVKRVERVRQLLGEAGLDESRVRMDFLSSLDSHRLAEILQGMKRSEA